MMNNEKSCRTCVHAIFDERLGCYKCDVEELYIDEIDYCDEYKQRKDDLRISKGIIVDE